MGRFVVSGVKKDKKVTKIHEIVTGIGCVSAFFAYERGWGLKTRFAKHRSVTLYVVGFL